MTRGIKYVVPEKKKKRRRTDIYNTPEFASWSHFRRRCNDPKNRAYKYYGGRGIKVCERWQNSFQNFLQDMGPKPSPKHSLDRINNDGDYEPTNCRWTTWDVQMLNRRSCRMLNGKTMSALARELGVGRSTIGNRLKAGMTLEEAISKPIKKRIRVKK